MRLLLDTHVLLWWLSDSRSLGPRSRSAIADSRSAVWVSAASAWEISIKFALGRLSVSEEPAVLVPREIERNGFRELSVSVAHALAAGTLPRHHDDPFDRMLIAQASSDGLTLMTADPALEAYDVPLADATR